MSAGDPPDPAAATDPDEFLDLMNQLRLWAGQPSLRRLEQLGGATRAAGGRRIKALPASTTSYVLSGKAGGRLPRMPFVERYVTSCLMACGHPVEQGSRYLHRWLETWRALARTDRRDIVEEPAPGSPVGEGGVRRQLPMDIVEFTGRAQELRHLHAMAEAAEPSAPTIVTIEGMAGVGKTRLAIHAAHQLVNRGLFTDVQLWADLRGFDQDRPATDPAAVLDRFLRLLGVPTQRIPPDLDDRAAVYRDRLARENALVLLDNAADADQVRPLLPAAASCFVMITSRRGLAMLDGVEPLQLDVLPPDDAAALVTRLAGGERFRGDPAAAARIATLCGHLPIALGISARRLRSRTTWQPAHLIGRLERASVRSEQAHASFALSYRDLESRSRQLFRLLSLHPGTDFTADSASALLGTTAEDAEARLDTLLDEHLLQQTTPDRYHFHDLLREYATERTHAEDTLEQRQAAFHRVLTWYLHTADTAAQLLAPHRRRTFPLEPTACPAHDLDDHEQALAWCEAEHANLVAAVDAAAEYRLHAVAWQLSAVLLHYFYLRSHWDDWLSTHNVALRSARALNDPCGQAQIRKGLGIAYSDRRGFDEAIDHYRQALDLFTAMGDAHGLAWTRNNLGVAFVDLNQLPAAVDEFNTALALHRETGERTGEAICLNNLGDALRRTGDHQQAKRHLRAALAIQQENNDESGQRFTLHTMADLHQDDHDYEQAIRYYRQTVTLSQKLGDQWGTARALDHLGTAFAAIGHTKSAQDCWRDALALFDTLGRPESNDLRARLTTHDT